MMKRFLLAVATILTLGSGLLAAAQPAAAVNVFRACDDPAAAKTDVCQPAKDKNPSNPVIKALKSTIIILSVVIGIVAIIVIIISALNMVTSNGDSQATAKARSNIIYALVGVVIAALAIPIVSFVLNRIQ